MIERPTCDGCPYWQRLTVSPEQGLCRRRAPATAKPGEDDRSSVYLPLWPVTFEGDFCGENPDFVLYIIRSREEKLDE